MKEIMQKKRGNELRNKKMGEKMQKMDFEGKGKELACM